VSRLHKNGASSDNKMKSDYWMDILISITCRTTNVHRISVVHTHKPMNSTDLSVFKARILNVASILLLLAFVTWFVSYLMIQRNEHLLEGVESAQRSLNSIRREMHDDASIEYMRDKWGEHNRAVTYKTDALRRLEEKGWSPNLIVPLRYGSLLCCVVGGVLLVVGWCIPGKARETRTDYKANKHSLRHKHPWWVCDTRSIRLCYIDLGRMVGICGVCASAMYGGILA